MSGLAWDSHVKFLRAGRVSPYARYTWPEIGEWTPDAALPLVLCDNGWHVAKALDAIDWISDELYEVEIAGAWHSALNKTVAERARLVRRIPEWNEAAALTFIHAVASLWLPAAILDTETNHTRVSFVEAPLSLARSRESTLVRQCNALLAQAWATVTAALEDGHVWGDAAGNHLFHTAEHLYNEWSAYRTATGHEMVANSTGHRRRIQCYLTATRNLFANHTWSGVALASGATSMHMPAVSTASPWISRLETVSLFWSSIFPEGLTAVEVDHE